MWIYIVSGQLEIELGEDKAERRQKCEKKKVNTNVTGRSADDLRERLNFIKKYI